jgi:hypothetical protein
MNSNRDRMRDKTAAELRKKEKYDDDEEDEKMYSRVDSDKPIFDGDDPINDDHINDDGIKFMNQSQHSHASERSMLSKS